MSHRNWLREPTAPRRLCTAVEETARRERQRRGVDSLLGTCGENAVALANRLLVGEATPVVVWGWIEVSDADAPESVPEAYRQAVVHAWVEVEELDEIWMAELASEADGHIGESTVFRELPEEYNRIERHALDGRVEPGESLDETWERTRV